MSKQANPKLIGGFVLGAIALFVAGLLIFGSGKFFTRRLPVVMYFEGSVSGLDVGAPISFRGVKIGEVTKVFIRYDPSTNSMTIPVFAELAPERVTFAGTNAKDAGTGKNMPRLIEQGLRAQLAVPSLLTGQMAISVDFFPDTPIKAVNLYPDRLEIPTVPSTLQEVQSTLQAVVEKISQLPIEDLVKETRDAIHGFSVLANDPKLAQIIANTNDTMADAQRLLRNLDGRIDALASSVESTSRSTQGALKDAQQAFAASQRTLVELQGTLARTEDLVKTANTVIAPGSPLNYEMINALRDLSATARSVRSLSDALERNPNSLLFGRTQPASR